MQVPDPDQKALSGVPHWQQQSWRAGLPRSPSPAGLPCRIVLAALAASAALLLPLLLLLLLLQLLMLLLLLAYGLSHQACELSMDFPHRIFSTIREGILCNGVPEAQAWPIVLIFPT